MRPLGRHHQPVVETARTAISGSSTSLLSIGASLAHNRHVKGSGLAEEERFEPTSPV
jgi:hypothetical protein